MKRRYSILIMLWPVFIVSLVLALPLEMDDAVMLGAPGHALQALPAAGAAGSATPMDAYAAGSDPKRIPDSAIVTLLLLGTGLVGLVGINRTQL